MSDRICSAVRNVLPDHTILTSSDNYGYIENMKLMSPMTDGNIIYTFTSYEPYTIGFNTFNGWQTENSFWSYLKDIPYPVYEGVDYSKAVENCIELVPDALKTRAREALQNYIEGKSDAGRINNYPSLYNEQWHMLRAESLAEWSKKYGGVTILVAELGACDAWVNRASFNAAPGSGLSEKTRLKLISDTVSAYERYGIHWTFWEYNESFSVFDPSVRLGTWNSSAERFQSLVYPPLLDALGLEYEVG
jgi:hypothetical protein